MSISTRQTLICRLVIVAVVSTLTGCLNEQPSGPLNNGGVSAEAKPAERELPPDNAADVEALEKAKAWLTKDAAGRVTSVELSSSATD